jgi:hypothetical protein
MWRGRRAFNVIKLSFFWIAVKDKKIESKAYYVVGIAWWNFFKLIKQAKKKMGTNEKEETFLELQETASVGKMALSTAASRQPGSRVRNRSRAAPAAAGVQIAASGAVLSSSSAPSSAPVDRRAADGTSVRHESSPVKCLPCNTSVSWSMERWEGAGCSGARPFAEGRALCKKGAPLWGRACPCCLLHWQGAQAPWRFGDFLLLSCS